MTEKRGFAFKIFDRIVSWFFLFVIVFSLFGIVLVVSGFPKTHLFINPLTTFLASGILSCFCTVYFTRKEIEEELNRQRGAF